MDDFRDLKRDRLARHLRRHIQGEVRFDTASRQLYRTDASIYEIEPLGVAIPRVAADLPAIVQIAADLGVPITPRGGGTSLSGQAIGPGLVVDCSKYLDAILDIDPAGLTARVQPGLVLDTFNRELAKHGLQFGPEVATASRANLGGMIGNNSAGARSIVYGKTIDHVRRLKVVLADGSLADFAALTPSEWERPTPGRSLVDGIYRQVRQIVAANVEEIRRRFPRILRRVSGYNLDVFAESWHTQKTPVGLHQLIVGSEGTLALIAEAELKLVKRPRTRGLLVPHFASLTAAMDAVGACLELAPSAVELLDGMLIDLARGNLALQKHLELIEGKPAALLMVEFSGDEPAEVADRVDQLRQRLRGLEGVEAVVPALEPPRREPLWNLRRAAMPLLYGMRGDRKPVTFVEDTAVAPARLPEFVARFRDTLRRHGTDGAFYGHASVGCLHIRPLLNLKEPGEVGVMRQIAEEISDLVLEYGGSLSGEHGDGLARSEFNRKMFGPTVYEAFRQIKQAFDPNGLFNPGKIVDAPAMTEQLRYGPGYRPIALPTVFDYQKQEGLVRSVELCNGNGACRKLEGGTMCPSFRATRDEKDSTRGRANALRRALAGDQPVRELASHWVHEVLDLCLMCKACKAECPSNVDLAKLKAEFLNHYYQHHPRPLGHRLMARVHQLNRQGAAMASLANWLQSRRPVRWLMEKLAGIDRRRSLPAFHADHFRRWFEDRGSRIEDRGSKRVILLDDCFTTYNEPEIGQAAVRVLERAGCSIELAGLVCCGRPMISKGFLTEAKQLIEQQLPALSRRLVDGTPILGLEPSCLLTLADEWPELVPGVDAERVAAAAHLADGWLDQQLRTGQADLPLRPAPGPCLLHVHCHQKALVGVEGTADLLRRVPRLDLQVLDAGCCGMAGSFGFEREHYDLSVQIAELVLLPALRAQPHARLAAPGTSCRHQIKDLANRRALHPLEIVAAALDG